MHFACRLLIGVATAVALCPAALAQTAHSAGAPTSRWLDVPQAGEMRNAYPPIALARGVPATTEMACKVRPDGTLNRCRLLGESPALLGFGNATLGVSDGFRMKPGTFDDLAVPDTVVVDFRWAVQGSINKPPKGPFVFGDEAALITDGHLSTPLDSKSALACFTQEPDPHCRTRPLSWGGAPDGEKALLSVLKNGPRDGIDIVVCDVTADRGLAGCRATSAAAQAVMQDVVASFRARDRADDGTPIGSGPVMIQIEWGPLHDAASALAAMR